MRVDSPAFSAKNVALFKEPRFAIEQAFDENGTIVRWMTSHEDTALPDGISTPIVGVIQGLSGTGQQLNPDKAVSTIGNFNYQIVDKSGALTTELATLLGSGLSNRRRRTRVYVGYKDLPWSDYALVQTQLVDSVTYKGGRYSFKCLDVQRIARKDVFDPVSTQLSASLLAADTTVNVNDASEFEMLSHGGSYSDAPNATVGYLKIEDEIIRYTGKTSTTFTGCIRGAMNTVAVDHLVDPSADQDQATKVEEYIYFELPVMRAIFAVLTGIVPEPYLSLPGSAGNYASIPDSAATSFAGDFEIIARVAPADWTPSSTNMIVGKYGLSGNFGYALSLEGTTGKLILQFSADGTTQSIATSTVATGFSDGSAHWVRAVRIKSSGTARFYTSANYNPDTLGGSWTQLGSDITGLSTSNLFDSSSFVGVGDWEFDDRMFSGKIYFAEVRDGTPGVRVACFDARMAANESARSIGSKTNETWTVNQNGVTPAAIVSGDVAFPSGWNCGVPNAYMRMSDFLTIGGDLNQYDDAEGLVLRFDWLTKTDGKQFCEEQLNLPAGTFMPVYADGALGCRRSTNVLAGAAYSGMLDDDPFGENNVVDYSELQHDFGSLHNLLVVEWNWERSKKDYTRDAVLIDQDSVDTYQEGDPFKLSFRGLHGSRHTAVTLQRLFDSLRDRYAAPPYRITVQTLASQNVMEVGDIARVRLSGLRDYVAAAFDPGSILDRSFEVQNVSVNWQTGKVSLDLFASTQRPTPDPVTADTSVLTSAFRTSQGTSLASALGGALTGSNPAHISSNCSLAGTSDANEAASIFYVDDDLQIDAGKTLTITGNVQLRHKHLQVNGKIDGKGGGLAGAVTSGTGHVASSTSYVSGRQGAIGATEAGGGWTIFSGSILGFVSKVSYVRGGRTGDAVRTPTGDAGRPASLASVPHLNVVWDGTMVSGLPSDLRGSSGSTGMPLTLTQDGDHGFYEGGAGGAGGAGLVLVGAGVTIGAGGSIDLSGADGSLGSTQGTSMNTLMFAGSGAGGAPGGMFILLDGALTTVSGVDESTFLANEGKTPIPPNSLTYDDWLAQGAPFTNLRSKFVGTGDGTLFPLPSLSGERGGYRAQYVPGPIIPKADAQIGDQVLSQMADAFIANNWTRQTTDSTQSLKNIRYMPGAPYPYACGGTGTTGDIVVSKDAARWERQTNPTTAPVNDFAWNGTCYVAVGGSGTTNLLLRSTDGITWTQQTVPDSTVILQGVAWGAGVFVAAGAVGTTAKIWTSSDGTTWTARTSANSGAQTAVAFDNGIFVVGGSSGTVANIQTSSDGTTWTTQTIDAPSGWGPNAFAFGNGTWVTVGGEFMYAYSRDNGANWTKNTLPSPFKVSGAVSCLAFSGKVFAAGGVATTGTNQSALAVSRDGAIWSPRTGPLTRLRGMAFSNSFWITVGNAEGGTGYIATSLRKN